jgi:hypothetical protein
MKKFNLKEGNLYRSYSGSKIKIVCRLKETDAPKDKNADWGTIQYHWIGIYNYGDREEEKIFRYADNGESWEGPNKDSWIKEPWIETKEFRKFIVIHLISRDLDGNPLTQTSGVYGSYAAARKFIETNPGLDQPQVIDLLPKFTIS